MMMHLRPYQQDAIDAVYRHLRERDDNPVVVIPTAGGKTPILATICRDAVSRWNGRVLVVSHVKELLQQAVDKLKQVCPELPVGVYSAGLNRRDTTHRVIVAGIQSIYKRACELDAFDLIIVDECFVAGTLVSTPSGNVPIEQAQPGMFVFNALGIDRVVATSARQVRQLVTLEFSDESTITCTPNHPIFTERGWTPAGSLELGAMVLGGEGLRVLRQRVSPMDETAARRKTHGSKGEPLAAAEILFNLLFEDPQQLHAIFGSTGEGEHRHESARTPAAETRRQWADYDSATKLAHTARSGVDCGVSGSRSTAPAAATSQTSKDRRCQPFSEDRDRTRRTQSSISHSSAARLTEVELPGSKRLVRISHHESAGGRVVYNLHVAGHPSYFANGTLVHNCHLIPSDGDGMYRQFLAEAKVLNPHLRVIGLTATPYRLDAGPIYSADHFLNAICYEIGIKALIRDGFLCPLVSKSGVAKVDTSALHVRGGEFMADEVEDLMDQDAVVEAACHEIIDYTRDRNACLIFAAGVKHGRHVAATLQAKHGIECGFVCGDTPAGERDELLARFRGDKASGLFPRAPLRYLCNVNVLTTGFDAPHIDCVALLRPTMSPGLYYQMVGRGFRLHPSKQNCLVLDFGGNVLRHGPVDQIKVKEKAGTGAGAAPAKECPECHSVVAAGYAACPDCGFVFPIPERQSHEAQASDAGVLSGQVTNTKFRVSDVYYSVHTKRGASEDDPKSMRVDYKVRWHEYKSEWICFEHEGYARQKAVAWWKRRSPDPVPDTAERAVELAQCGALATTTAITVRAVAGEPYERITDYELGEMPDPLPSEVAPNESLDDIPF
jgi:DNA repair protein RadD